jgi:glycosyltransferase involved in cell wall biosynthesis
MSSASSGDLRIAITMQSLDPSWGGIGIYTMELVNSLLRRDRDNSYILVYPGFGRARLQAGRFETRYENVREVVTNGWSVPNATWWDQVVLPRALAAHRVDVVFNPFWSAPLFGDYRKVTTMHDVTAALLANTPGRAFDLKRRLQQGLRNHLLLGAIDRVISISHTMTADLLRYTRIPEERIRTVWHGVSERFRPVGSADVLARIRAAYRLPERFVLFVGHIYPQKNFGNLVRAFARVAAALDQHLVVAGRHRWNSEGEVALVDELGLSDRVHFLSYVEHEDLPALYSLASCFAFPSFYEGFGLVLLEAMACGCPAVASRGGAVPEVAGDAAMLFDPHSVDEIAACLERMLTDPDLRADHVQRGLVRARQFTWDRCAEETLRVLAETVRAPVLPAGLATSRA